MISEVIIPSSLGGQKCSQNKKKSAFKDNKNIKNSPIFQMKITIEKRGF